MHVQSDMHYMQKLARRPSSRWHDLTDHLTDHLACHKVMLPQACLFERGGLNCFVGLALEVPTCAYLSVVFCKAVQTQHRALLRVAPSCDKARPVVHFQVGAHSLPIEQGRIGRLKVPRLLCRCTFCTTNVSDSPHFGDLWQQHATSKPLYLLSDLVICCAEYRDRRAMFRSYWRATAQRFRVLRCHLGHLQAQPASVEE